ncbi:hypothetical protein OG883_22420 [Streptomyces sp. NBC_01142]|uniref:hypothetical protein n=1 Tax=Streptomyces sp. NBC_01142 TaxID=2975865 RepID=UPI00224D1515|nr:hypothetical protein [Streptomyces sp. NBC_01142]MCX4822602.1 hypothetical protein [Streptomyces sp. NBC_01142]
MDQHQWQALSGIASNPSTPAPLLLRLLAFEDRDILHAVARRADLPDEVVDAIVAHPTAHVRGTFAQSVLGDPVQRARLAHDPTGSVRFALAAGPMPYGKPKPLPDWAYERLLADERPQVVYEALGSATISPRFLAGLADHTSPGFRYWACRRTWHLLPEETRRALLRDEDPDVRRAASLHVYEEDEQLTGELVEALDGEGELGDVLRRGRLSRDVAEQALRKRTRLPDLAANPSLPADLVALLATDENPRVRLAVSARPELTEEERAAIDYEVGPEDRLGTLDWVWRAREDLDVLRRCVTSAHPWLRRSAAVSPHVPPDLVQLLASDEDFAVRLLLCEYHPEPPPELLLDVYVHGEHRAREMLIVRPGFPKAGLAAIFADHPEPWRRSRALYDPGASAELVDRLSREEVASVRRSAARDPRLSVERIRELLSDPEAAAGAGGNPSLPVEDMLRLLDEAGVPASVAYPAGPAQAR